MEQTQEPRPHLTCWVNDACSDLFGHSPMDNDKMRDPIFTISISISPYIYIYILTIPFLLHAVLIWISISSSSDRLMDRPSSKRPRESSSSPAALSPDVTYQQSEIANGEKRQHLDAREPSNNHSPGRLFDLDLSFGVFDFPWSKDSLISKSEDWKFDDVFFTSFDGALSTSADAALTIGTAFTELSGQLVWCNLPDPWEKEYEAHAGPPLDGGGPAEGMDCIWSSLLNQPLQQGSSAL